MHDLIKNFKPRSLMEIAETAQKNDEAKQNAEKSNGTAIIDAASEDAELHSDQINQMIIDKTTILDMPTDKATQLRASTVMPTGQVLGDAAVDQQVVLKPDTTSLDAPQSLLETPSNDGESPSTGCEWRVETPRRMKTP